MYSKKNYLSKTICEKKKIYDLMYFFYSLIHRQLNMKKLKVHTQKAPSEGKIQNKNINILNHWIIKKFFMHI